MCLHGSTLPDMYSVTDEVRFYSKRMQEASLSFMPVWKSRPISYMLTNV